MHPKVMSITHAAHYFGYTLAHIHDLLGCPCVALLLSGKEYPGFLYNVDPETRTLLLLQQHDQGQSTMVAIRSTSLKSIRIDRDSPNRKSLEEMDNVAHVDPCPAQMEDVQLRKDRLVADLRSKRIPVEVSAEDPVVHIMDCAHVRAPYLGSSVSCANPIIRERVKAMIQDLDRRS